MKSLISRRVKLNDGREGLIWKVTSPQKDPIYTVAGNDFMCNVTESEFFVIPEDIERIEVKEEEEIEDSEE